MPTIHFAVSLGVACRTAHQLRRAYGASAPSGVFDWQITPVKALVQYLAHDLRGMFDLGDLFVDENGIVCHRRLGTRHQHEFPGDVTEDTLPALYPRARQRHEYLCDKFRRVVAAGSPTLFAVATHFRTEAEAAMPEIARLVRRMNDGAPFHFLFEPPEGYSETDWRGNDKAWDDALEPYRVPRAVRVKAWWKAMLRKSST